MTETQAVTLNDLLSIEGFDPLKIDLENLQAISREIPQDGNIDINNAEVLSVKFLRAADMCGDILGQISRYEGATDTRVRTTKADAIQLLAEQKVPATTQAQRYGNNEKFIEASNKNTDAKAVKEWLQRKYDLLIRAHYICRDVARRFGAGEKASTIGSGPDELYDEGSHEQEPSGKMSWGN